MQAYSSRGARKYLIQQGLHFKLTRALWEHTLKSGRLYPDVGHKYSQALLDEYRAEVKPR